MNAFGTLLSGMLVLGIACKPQRASSTDGPPEHLVQSAREFFDAYTRDLRAHSRGRLADYYDPNGAVIVIAGHRRFYSRAALDTFYRGAWQPPAFFAWDTLAFDSLSPELVLVTGRFRWLVAENPDTARYIYASILQAVDSGLAIRVEHETPAPRPR
jgi:hypothetical protein